MIAIDQANLRKKLKRQYNYLLSRLFTLEPGTDEHDKVFEKLRDARDAFQEAAEWNN